MPQPYPTHFGPDHRQPLPMRILLTPVDFQNQETLQAPPLAGSIDSALYLPSQSQSAPQPGFARPFLLSDISSSFQSFWNPKALPPDVLA